MSDDPKNFKERLTTFIDLAKQKAGEGFTKLSQIPMPEKLKNLIKKDASEQPRSAPSPTKAAPQFNLRDRIQTLLEWIIARVKNRNAQFYGRLITLLLCSFFIADILAILVDSQIPEPKLILGSGYSDRTNQNKRSPEHYQIILARNLFNSPDESKPAPTNLEPVPTTLQFNLVGTLILQNELRSIATIEDKAAQLVYPVRATDEIPGKAKIISVGARRVVFLNTTNNQKEYVELPVDLIKAPTISFPAAKASGGIEQISDGQYNISRSAVDKAMGDFNQILTQARCVPNFENGLPSGFKCFSIAKGSIFEQLGIKENDVICGINNQPLNDLTKAFEQLKELGTANHIDLCVKRAGRQQNYSYDIR